MFYEKFNIPLDKFSKSVDNGQIIKRNDKYWLKGFENIIEVKCVIDNQEIKFKSIFDNLVMKCIATGDQQLWNHLFPHILSFSFS